MHPLLDAVAAGAPYAVEALHTALVAAGGPLRVPAEEGRVTLTFVWIGDADAVSVQCGLVEQGRSSALSRVGATGVFALEVPAPGDTLTSYRFVIDDPFLRESATDEASRQRLTLEAQDRAFADPNNPQRIAPLAVLFGHPVTDDRFESVLSLRGAPVAPWFAAHDAPAGQLSAIDHSSRALGSTRTVTIWSPPTVGADLPLVVLLDGESYLQIAQLPRALDLAAQRGDIPPAIIAMVPNADDSTGFVDRSRELTCNAEHARMLADELIPVLRSKFPIDPSPTATVLGGSGLGGLQSIYAAFEHPDVVGNVLSVSSRLQYGHEAPEWLTARLATEPLRQIRIYQQVGRLDDEAPTSAPDLTNLEVNRRFRDAARTRGYDLWYDELGTAHDICAFRVATMRGLCHLLAR